MQRARKCTKTLKKTPVCAMYGVSAVWFLVVVLGHGCVTHGECLRCHIRELETRRQKHHRNHDRSNPFCNPLKQIERCDALNALFIFDAVHCVHMTSHSCPSQWRDPPRRSPQRLLRLLPVKVFLCRCAGFLGQRTRTCTDCKAL